MKKANPTPASASDPTAHMQHAIKDMTAYRRKQNVNAVEYAKFLYPNQGDLAMAISIRLNHVRPNATNAECILENIARCLSEKSGCFEDTGKALNCCYYAAFLATDAEIRSAYNSTIQSCGAVFVFEAFIGNFATCYDPNPLND